MKHRKVIFSVLLVLGLILMGQWSQADDSSRTARIRYVEGTVALYPSDADRPSDATVNSPILDGDEIETQNGRAEISFRNGVVVRLGDYSAIRFDSVYSPMTLELLQGTLFVDSHYVESFRDELEVRAGDAQVFLLDEGNLRIDLGNEGGVRVTTLDGKAEVRARGDRVLLDKEQRTYVDPGNSPQRAEAYTKNYDELDDWNQGRIDAFADMGKSQDYVQDSLYYDTYDLNGYGDWRSYGDYGNVWVPRVSVGWRPYYDGRWSYVNDNYFWVSNEPWGWAPYHYGRWDYSGSFGWFWIPGYTFGPSWVSWYDYGDYIGWCPLNYYNYPAYYYNNYGYNNHGGYYPPVQKQKTLGVDNSWTFVKKAALGESNIKRISVPASNIKGDLRIDKDRVQLMPSKSLVPYVAGKGNLQKGGASVQKPSATLPNRWNGAGKSKSDWDDRGTPTRKPDSVSPGGSGQSHGSSSNQGSSKSVEPGQKSNSGSKAAPAKKAPSSTVKKPSGSGSSPSNKKPAPPNYNRDVEFQKYGEQNYYSGSRLSREPVSPTNRDSQFRTWGSSRQGNDSRNFDTWKTFRGDNSRAGDERTPWYRDPGTSNVQRDQDGTLQASPRYLEGAKKVFDGYQSSRSGSSPDNGSSNSGYTRDSGRSAPASSGRVESHSSGSPKSYGSSGNRNSGGSSKAAGSKPSGGSSNKKPH